MNNKNVACDCLNDLCLSKVPLFASLSKESLTTITKEMNHKTFHKGQMIVYEGQEPLGFTVIQKGSAKAYRISSDGKEQILYIFPTHDYFGGRFLFTEENVPYSVEALEETTVCILSKKQFMELLANHPPVALQLIEAMANRMRRLETSIQVMGGRNAELRIASLLVEFIDTFGSKTDEGFLVKMPLSREGIANYLGLARETLSRKLVQLEEESIIKFLDGKTMLVLDKEALQNLSIFSTE